MPVQRDLDELAPEKTIGEIEDTMADVKFGIDTAKDKKKRDGEAPAFARAGQSTQLVVGASESSDAVILTKAEELYERFLLRRVYYSAYSPAEQTSTTLLAKPATPAMREHRLYEADWLVRNYNYSASEIMEGTEDNLDLEIDPKLAWALRHRSLFPLDVNRVSRSLLLRLPGVGVRNVDRILKIRRHQRIRLDDLARLRVNLSRAKYFVMTADHNRELKYLDALDLRQKFVRPRTTLLGLFDTPAMPVSVVTGEL
jgi:predicted DNA-binding helix-hairpin-helix protein